MASRAPIAASTSRAPATTLGPNPDRGRRPAGRLPHGVDRAGVQVLVVVGEGERTDPLPHGDDAIEGTSVDATSAGKQPAFAEPCGQGLRTRERLTAAGREVEVRVHERLDERQLTWGRLPADGLRSGAVWILTSQTNP
jgi:hypothetical protein